MEKCIKGKQRGIGEEEGDRLATTINVGELYEKENTQKQSTPNEINSLGAESASEVVRVV
ncbi:hypothetical protein CE91St14_09630 [Porphyromonas somerae]|nr:hypothetical protein CE91St14_09630 [Porphyromonas somerae]